MSNDAKNANVNNRYEVTLGESNWGWFERQRSITLFLAEKSREMLPRWAGATSLPSGLLQGTHWLPQSGKTLSRVMRQETRDIRVPTITETDYLLDRS